MLPTPLTSDKRLVRRTLAGRREAFNVLVERHIHLVQSLAYAQTGNYADAQDATQETFIKAYQALDTLREPAKFASWLSTIARRVCWEFKRDAQRRFNREQKAHDEERVTTPDMERREMLENTREHLDRLSPDDRELLMLRYYAGKRVKEIAGVLGITSNTVAKRLQRAREALGEELMQSLGAAREDERQTKKRVGQIGAAITAAGATWASGGTAAAATGAGLGAAAFLKAGAVILALIALSVGVWTVQRNSGEPQRPVAAVASISSDSTGSADSLEAPQEVAFGDTLPGSDAPVRPTESIEVTLASTSEGAAISGRVYDEETEAGIAGVEVQAYAYLHPGALGYKKSVQTDASGVYKFTGLAEQTYKITIWAPEGYPDQPTDSRTWPEVAAKTGKEFSGVDFPLSKGIVIAGRVTDEAGAPLAGVEVTARTIPNEGIGSDARTDANGAFTIRLSEDAAKINLYTVRTGYAASPTGPYEVPPTGLKGVQLQMGPEGVIEGRLVDAAGKPLAGYRVMCRPRPFRYSVISGVGTEPTAEDGSFRITGLYPATWHIDRVNLPGDFSIKTAKLTELTQVRLAQGEKARGLVLVLADPPTLTITGRITSDTGDAIPRAEVTARPMYGELQESRKATTGADGRYCIEGLAAGHYGMTVRHLEYGHEARPHIAAGSDRVNFVLQKRGAIAGRVVDATTGKPIPAFLIDDKRFQDPEGRFQLSDSGPGESHFRVKADGYQPELVTDIVVNPGATAEDVVIALTPGIVIKGVVRDPDGEPVPNATVFIDHFVMRADLFREMADAVSDTAGRFTLASVPADATKIWALHPRYAQGQTPIPAQRHGTVELEVWLQTPATLRGVVQADGAPLPGVRIQEVMGAVELETSTDAEGNYTVTGLLEGTRELEFRRLFETVSPPYERRTRKKVYVRAGEETRCDVDFSTWDTQVEGRVTLNGTAIDARLVVLEFSYDTGEGERDQFTAYPDAEGYYALYGTRPGPAAVNLLIFGLQISGQEVPQNKKLDAREVTITEGSVTTFNLDYEL